MPTRSRWTAAVLVAWPALLAALLCWPLLTQSGLPLAKDLVFVPDQPLTTGAIGLGDAAPRAVPLDSVVAVLDSLVGGAVLARVLLFLSLALAGWGVARVLGDLGLVARLSATGFAVWNPFVVERLALGQWALLLGYASLPWVVLAARRFRDEGGAAAWGGLTAWVALGSVTPTGGLLASATALVLAWGQRRRALTVAATCLVLQLPWLAPAFLGGAGSTSDPAGVDIFSAGDEGPGSVVTALLGLGGIWDAGSVPTTREGWWTPAAALVSVLVLLAGRRVMRRVLDTDLTRLTVLAAAGFALAVLSTAPGGLELVEWAVEHVPGAGLLRDSHKFLAPYAVLLALSLGATVDRISSAVARRGGELALTVAVVAIPLPLVLLPDATVAVWPTVEPVRMWPGLDDVDDVTDGQPGDLAVLPWRSYRGFSWGNGEVSSDPATRWFDRDVVVSQDLQVGDVLLEGEGARSRRIGDGLADGEPAAEVLAREGITFALVYLDDPDYSPELVTGLDLIYEDVKMGVYRVPDPEPAPATPDSRLLLVAIAAVLGPLLAGVGLAAATAGGWRRRKASAR